MSWWRRHYQIVFFISPLIILAVLYIVSLWPSNYFLEFVKEDKPIENLQVIVLLVGVGVLSWQLWQYRQILSPWKKALTAFMILGLFFVAGDEISWGQRLLGITTPDALREINLQEETTLHNIQGVQGFTESAYLIIGIFGGFGWIFKKYLPRRLQFFIAPSYLAPLFLTQVIYYAYPFYWGENRIKQWSEVMELLFYLAVISHAAVIFYRLKSTS